MPVKYELVLPEGTTLDQTDVDAISAIAKEKGWTNEQAQAALVETHQSLANQSARFREQLDAHPEIGGANFEAAERNARRAFDHFLPATSVEGAALRTAITKNGYGNFAPFVLLLSRIGKAMGEDGALSTDPARALPPTDMVDLFYGKKP